MVYLGISLASQYFPISVGAGNFGSVMSDNSPVYKILGVSNNDFFINLEGVYDSNLASILGEYGFLGLFFYLFLTYKILGFLFVNYFSIRIISFSAIFIVFLTQPFFSYQVNSINFLIFVFSLREYLDSKNENSPNF